MEAELAILPQGFTLRVATKNDLDAITRIHIKGFTEEPYIHYCFPLRDEYPKDYWKWTRKEYQNYLEQPQKFLVHVLDAPCESDGEATIETIGLAIWNLAVLKEAKGTDPIFNERRDANMKHCKAFREKAGKRFKTYFAKWAEKQINLATLVVHPDHRRRGAGTMLVKWGIEAAEEKGWPVTLCASPMGRFLYEHLHFKVIAIEVVQVEGEKETLKSAVMVYGSGADGQAYSELVSVATD
jgi:GNAT superfamily N-acetyltransferase